MKRIIFLLLLLSTFFPLMAQQAEIQISSKTTYLGQPVQILLVVTDGKAEIPELPESQNYTLQYQGVSTAVQSSLINGKSSQTIQRRYTWLLIPRKTGILTFPSLDVTVEGIEIQTKPFSITVKEARDVEGTFVEYELPDHKIYPGQEITLNVVWYFSMAVSSPHYSFPFLELENINFSQPPPPSKQSAELYTFEISGQKVFAERSAALINGEQYSTLTFPWIMTVNKPGSYTLPPLGISMEVSTGRRDSWMNPVYEPAAIQSKKSELKVSPLPQAIKNSPFGVILSNGELKVSTSLDPLTAYVGDPLTLTIEFTNGIGLRNYDMPPLTQWEEVVTKFKVPSERSNGRFNNDILTVNQTIRPKSAQSNIFPSLEFLYLDVATGKVRKSRTEPINIELQTTSIVNSLDIENLGEGHESINKLGLEEHAEGIAAFIPWNHIKKNRILAAQEQRGPLYIMLICLPLIPLIIIAFNNIIQRSLVKRQSSFTTTKKKILSYTHGEISLAEIEKLLNSLENSMPPNPHIDILKDKLQEIRFSGLSEAATSGLNSTMKDLFMHWEDKVVK